MGSRKEASDIKTQCELAAYFTHSNLQPTHLALSLISAMSASVKAKNYKTASGFARRLLELNPNHKGAGQARKVIQLAEQHQHNEEHQLDYDEKNPFVICGLSMKPIYRGAEQLRCSYCYQPFLPQHRDAVCPVCLIGTVGADASGMVNSYGQLK
eukprot:NODE_3815_length_728_cov_84.661267_g3216_i0.p2 GENE.NODE_3815_length_728_cov_84.661267_g3216_i0~~NODE_3815_length_728_cov_84.661267_g3216_i0.p2  ORF type:complete len:164 (+),score=65.81 NODE_3815_length_728_cov_84.661267_g3216_i0:28-492(+)